MALPQPLPSWSGGTAATSTMQLFQVDPKGALEHLSLACRQNIVRAKHTPGNGAGAMLLFESMLHQYIYPILFVVFLAGDSTLTLMNDDDSDGYNSRGGQGSVEGDDSYEDGDTTAASSSSSSSNPDAAQTTSPT